MASFKSNPIYYSVLGVLGLAALAAGWGIYDRHAASEKSAALLVQKRNELNALQAVNPVPSEASKAAVEADLLRTEAALAKMRAELKGSGPFAENLRTTRAPSEPTDVFFNLETFVERTRQKAEAAKVKVKADERFGFYTYDRTGPDRDLIPQVFKQRQVVEYLVDALIEAKPSELLAVNRERPLTKAALAAIAAGQPAPQSTTGAAAANNPANKDFFDIDPRISARVPGFVGASAFRLTFISETESLRVLLNKLAGFELPLVVRSVEVEPMPKTQSSTAPAQSNSLSSIFGNTTPSIPAALPEPKPLVEKVLSKFTVTVELIDLVESPAIEATPTS
jgi:hypothetical protein